jgi:hypothetical protein
VAETVRESTAADGESWLRRERIAEPALRRRGNEFCSALRRKEMEHAETREGFGLERVVSCGRSEQRWGAKLDLGSSELLDNHHRSTTLGTAPQVM